MRAPRAFLRANDGADDDSRHWRDASSAMCEVNSNGWAANSAPVAAYLPYKAATVVGEAGVAEAAAGAARSSKSEPAACPLSGCAAADRGEPLEARRPPRSPHLRGGRLGASKSEPQRAARLARSRSRGRGRSLSWSWSLSRSGGHVSARGLTFPGVPRKRSSSSANGHPRSTAALAGAATRRQPEAAPLLLLLCEAAPAAAEAAEPAHKRHHYNSRHYNAERPEQEHHAMTNDNHHTRAPQNKINHKQRHKEHRRPRHTETAGRTGKSAPEEEEELNGGGGGCGGARRGAAHDRHRSSRKQEEPRRQWAGGARPQKVQEQEESEEGPAGSETNGLAGYESLMSRWQVSKTANPPQAPETMMMMRAADKSHSETLPDADGASKRTATSGSSNNNTTTQAPMNLSGSWEGRGDLKAAESAAAARTYTLAVGEQLVQLIERQECQRQLALARSVAHAAAAAAAAAAAGGQAAAAQVATAGRNLLFPRQHQQQQHTAPYQPYEPEQHHQQQPHQTHRYRTNSANELVSFSALQHQFASLQSLSAVATALQKQQEQQQYHAQQSTTTIEPARTSARRGTRTREMRKCRKVYGMEQRQLWCTQCKWKKACSRFCDRRAMSGASVLQRQVALPRSPAAAGQAP